ncbi:MaoC family dehydratase [Tateyamaria sp. SN6-1]|uniref:MaoC family dehydratase n=1 Tax=Tateyamaria sp. SN6-1 TaxID=3092148 RepID=UPI0039F57AF4
MTARDTALADLRTQVGQDIAPSRWITVTQGMIDRFADVTADDQFIHIDPARAAATPLGGTVAHGFLTLSLASRFDYDCFEDLPGQAMSINYGFNRLRFLAPVRPGDRIRGHFTLIDVAPRGDDGLMRSVDLRIEIEGGDKPALAAVWLALILFETP